MSDLKGNLDLKTIVAPSLTQTNYGKNIREKFDNIDDNLRRLANRDFVAGKAGKDIKFAKYLLWDKSESNPNYSSEQKIPFTELGQAFVEAIVGSSDIWGAENWDKTTEDFTNDFYNSHSTLASVTIGGVKHTFFDYFEKNPEITIMYQLVDHEAPDEEANRSKVCSPYVYVFIDERYAILGEVVSRDPNVYAPLEDNSCLLNLTYNEGPQITRINQFPTLYYDGQGQFRWKLYGSESGILATGPKGTDATAAPITFARLSRSVPNSSSPETNPGDSGNEQIASILHIDENGATWTPIGSGHNLHVGDPILAFRPTDGDSEGHSVITSPHTVYITKVTAVSETGASVSTAAATSLQFLMDNTVFVDMMSSLRRGSMGTQCMFVLATSTSSGTGIDNDGDIPEDTVVHAAWGSEASESGVDIHTLVIKPIHYSEIADVANATIAGGTPKISVEGYKEVSLDSLLTVKKGAVINPSGTANALVVGGKMVANGSLTCNDTVYAKDVSVFNKTTTKDLSVTNQLCVEDTNNKVSIGKDYISFQTKSGSSWNTYTNIDRTNVNTENVSANTKVQTPLLESTGNILEANAASKIRLHSSETVVYADKDADVRIKEDASNKPTGEILEHGSNNTAHLIVRGCIKPRSGIAWDGFGYASANSVLERAQNSQGIKTLTWLGEYSKTSSSGSVTDKKDTIYVDWRDVIKSTYTTYTGTTVSIAEKNASTTPTLMSGNVLVVGYGGISVDVTSFAYKSSGHWKVDKQLEKRIVFYNCPAYREIYLFWQIRYTHHFGSTIDVANKRASLDLDYIKFCFSTDNKATTRANDKNAAGTPTNYYTSFTPKQLDLGIDPRTLPVDLIHPASASSITWKLQNPDNLISEGLFTFSHQYIRKTSPTIIARYLAVTGQIDIRNSVYFYPGATLKFANSYIYTSSYGGTGRSSSNPSYINVPPGCKLILVDSEYAVLCFPVEDWQPGQELHVWRSKTFWTLDRKNGTAEDWALSKFYDKGSYKLVIRDVTIKKDGKSYHAVFWAGGGLNVNEASSQSI